MTAIVRSICSAVKAVEAVQAGQCRGAAISHAFCYTGGGRLPQLPGHKISHAHVTPQI